MPHLQTVGETHLWPHVQTLIQPPCATGFKMGVLFWALNTSALLLVIEERLSALQYGKDVLHFWLLYTFDSVPHLPLVLKLENLGFNKHILHWISGYLAIHSESVRLISSACFLFKYLSVLLSHDLSWGEHCQSICTNARKMAWPPLQKILQQCSGWYSTPTLHLPCHDPSRLCLSHLVALPKQGHNWAWKLACQMATALWESSYQGLLELVDLPMAKNSAVYYTRSTVLINQF